MAANQVWDEVLRMRASGKPVIASVGNTAASGRYAIAGQTSCLIVADHFFVVPGSAALRPSSC